MFVRPDDKDLAHHSGTTHVSSNMTRVPRHLAGAAMIEAANRSKDSRSSRGDTVVEVEVRGNDPEELTFHPVQSSSITVVAQPLSVVSTTTSSDGPCGNKTRKIKCLHSVQANRGRSVSQPLPFKTSSHMQICSA